MQWPQRVLAAVVVAAGLALAIPTAPARVQATEQILGYAVDLRLEAGGTLLVTGASGFVGSQLAAALVESGHRVRAMTRHPDAYQGAGDPVSAAHVGRPGTATPSSNRRLAWTSSSSAPATSA